LPENIRAFLSIYNAPPNLRITVGQVYLVRSCRKYEDQKVWVKSIRPEKDRMWVFAFNDDSGKECQLALDLDDQAIVFITAENVEKLKNQGA